MLLAKEAPVELERNLVKECFLGILQRQITDEAALNQAAATLAAGMSLSDYIRGLLNSLEYQSRIGLGSGFSNFTPVCADLGDRRLWVDLSDMAVSRICLTGSYEPEDTQFIKNSLKPGDIFIDIGANIGWFTTLAASLVGAHGHVHAFEPRDETRGLLTRSIQENDFVSRVTIHGFPLAEKRAEARLVWMDGTDNPGGSRLSTNPNDTFEGMAAQDVFTIPLDDVKIDGRVSLVKLDVEGAEGNVLKGARHFLKRNKPIILSEVFGPALLHVSNIDLDGYVRLIHDLEYEIYSLRQAGLGTVLKAEDLVSDSPFNVILLPNP